MARSASPTLPIIIWHIFVHTARCKYGSTTISRRPFEAFDLDFHVQSVKFQKSWPTRAIERGKSMYIVYWMSWLLSRFMQIYPPSCLKNATVPYCKDRKTSWNSWYRRPCHANFDIYNPWILLFKSRNRSSSKTRSGRERAESAQLITSAPSVHGWIHSGQQGTSPWMERYTGSVALWHSRQFYELQVTSVLYVVQSYARNNQGCGLCRNEWLWRRAMI